MISPILILIMDLKTILVFTESYEYSSGPDGYQAIANLIVKKLKIMIC